MDDDYNREAFLTARQATVAPTFHAARALLAGIAVERVTDADVESYVSLCRELAEYCIAHGVQRGADLNPLEVLRTASWSRVAKTVAGRMLRGDLWAPVWVALEGGMFAARLPGWSKLQDRLASRYEG